MKNQWFALSLLAAMSTSALAQDNSTEAQTKPETSAYQESFYVFGDFGLSTIDDGIDELDGSSLGIGMGYTFSPSMAVELGYQKGSYDWDATLTQIQLTGVGSFPITPEANLYGRLGLASVGLSCEDCDGIAISDMALLFGAGVSYALDKNLALRAEYNMTTETDYEVGSTEFSFGALYKF